MKERKNSKKRRWKNSEKDESKFAHIEPVQAKHLEVKVNNDFERALKIFRSLCQKEKILSTYKEKQRYEKPSDRKRRKRNEMKRKLLEVNSKEKNFKIKSRNEELE